MKERVSKPVKMMKLRFMDIPVRIIAWVISIFYGVSLIPILVLSAYNYPSADDFSMGARCHVAWMETGSFFAVIGNACGHAIDDWFHWIGYYTSDFLNAMPPSSFGETYYVWTTSIILLFLHIGVYYFGYVLLVKVLKVDKYLSHIAIIATLYIFIQCMCDAGRCEAFFWYCGGSNYIMMFAYELFWLALMIQLFTRESKGGYGFLAFTTIFGFFLGGANQMTALNGAIWVVAFVIVLIFYKKYALLKRLVLPLLTPVVGFIINCIAPGNFLRAQQTDMQNPVNAILKSIYYYLERMITDWIDWSIIVILLLLIPVFWKLFANCRYRFSYPVIVILFTMGTVAAMVTPPIFVTNNMEAGRVQASAFMMFILTCVFNEAYVIGWLHTKLHWMIEESQAKHYCQAYCGILIAVFFIGNVLMIIPEPHYYTYSSAITDLRNGSAKQYKEEQLARFAHIEESLERGDMLITLKEFTVKPKLLFYMDIEDNPDTWPNTGLSKYYNTEARFALKRNENNISDEE